MKEIGILEFEQLVMARLANPRDFAGRSLVLWNADYAEHGIAQRIIKQCCERYNKENPNEQVWFRMPDMTFDSDDYTQPKTWHDWYEWNENTQKYNSRHELKRCGILFNTGDYVLSEQENWLKFVNTHTNSCGHIFQDCAVIVCAHPDLYPQRILKEEQFGSNCDIYSIQPTLDEWATWVAPYCNPEILKVVLAYIEKNGAGNNPQGFEYWQRIMKALDILVKVEGCPLNQIPKRLVEIKVMGVASTKSPAPEFCDFIYEQDTSM